MRGQMQAGPLRLVTAPVRGRVLAAGRARARERTADQAEQLAVMARLAQQRRESLRAATGRPHVALRRLPY